MLGTVFPWIVNTLVGHRHESILTANGSYGFKHPRCAPDPFAIYGFPTSNASDTSFLGPAGANYSVTTPLRYAFASTTQFTVDTVSCGWAAQASITVEATTAAATYASVILQVNATVPTVSAGAVCVPAPPGITSTSQPAVSIVESGVTLWSSVMGCAGAINASATGVLSCAVSNYTFYTLPFSNSTFAEVGLDDGDAATAVSAWSGVTVCFNVGSGKYSFLLATTPSVTHSGQSASNSKLTLADARTAPSTAPSDHQLTVASSSPSLAPSSLAIACIQVLARDL